MGCVASSSERRVGDEIIDLPARQGPALSRVAGSVWQGVRPGSNGLGWAAWASELLPGGEGD